MAIRRVHGSTTSLNGCKVEIDGYVMYSLIPPRITGFRGSVHISGEPGCPNGDLYFGTQPKGKVAPNMPVDKRKL